MLELCASALYIYKYKSTSLYTLKAKRQPFYV